MQSHPDAREVFAIVDDGRPPCGGLKYVVNGTHADRYAEQVTDELDDASIGAVADQR